MATRLIPMTLSDLIERQRQDLQNQGLVDADLPFYLNQAEFRTGLLLLHGSGASPCNHRALGQMLYGKGYRVLAPILAGHHDLNLLHSGQISWWDCYRSALELLQELKSECEQVFVIGSSFGGTLAYCLAAEHAELLAGLVALSAPVQSSEKWFPQDLWPQQVKASIEAADQCLHRVHSPCLILHGLDDRSVKVRHAWHAFERIPALRKQLLVYDRVGHAVGFAYNTPEVAESIHQFIANTQVLRHIRFAIPNQNYHQLAIAGEFNDWNAQSFLLRLEQGNWVGEISLMPGNYQYKLVINNQHWILDPENETVPTPHGEANSLLRVY